ncbi:hypothetical protein ABW20_dc0100726 [Dactylellina cionopaga]|nr:hypothetical protein ABW20_dc0100726 [Dactylellina cionopaga]
MNYITSCPPEILVQIFNNLSNKELAKLQLVCKEFYSTVPLCTATFVFALGNDAPWKLIRTLLTRPEMGKVFTKVVLDWTEERKGLWKWEEEEEVAKLEEAIEKFDLCCEITSAILGGLNAEALLPLLLCFTTRLGALDLGVPEPHSLDMEFKEDIYNEDLESMFENYINLCELLGEQSDFYSLEDWREEYFEPDLIDIDYFSYYIEEYLEPKRKRIKRTYIITLDEHFPAGDKHGNNRPLWFHKNLPTLSNLLPYLKHFET